MRGGRFKIDVQRVDRQRDGHRHHDHDKQEVLPDERDGQRRGRVHVGQQQEKHGEREQDGDGERDLLARVRRQVEDQHGKAGDGHARHDQVERVEQRAPTQSDVEGDVRVRLRAAWVELDPLHGGHVEDVPLHVGVVVPEVDAPRDDGVFALLGAVAEVLQVQLVAVVGPRGDLEEALLDVEGEVLHVDLAVAFVDGRRLPDDDPGVLDYGFGLQRDLEVAVSAGEVRVDVERTASCAPI